ncbi:hypothetical protein [Stutzerimonas nitrititolerans]|uniref:hypothetical protein n=1 Tax=Stutzerimonas nitrititolerans TaxID=2482751 RepID=UPI00289E58B9|nr:hypothetical protein [Stutzerimonas nitrititolerans]
MPGNLNIWESVQKTDPKFTKEYTGPGGFTGTAVNAQYLAMRATEVFGPCGTGWGYSVLEERFDIGGPLTNKEGAVLANAQVHTLKVELWYIGADGERKTVMHYGHTPFVTQNKFGIATDFEAPKKSLTDAIGKCLSQLGFSADIRLGLYDDIHYVNEVKAEAEIERAEDKIETRERQAAEYREWLENNLRLIRTAQSLNELQKVFASAIRKLDLRKDDTNKLKFTRAKDERKAELTALEAKA